MARKATDITGKTYGVLTVSHIAKDSDHGPLWECSCECGKTTLATYSELNRGRRSKYCSDDCVFRKEIADWSPVKTTYGNYKRNAVSRGYLFELTLEDFSGLMYAPCVYCGTVGSNTYQKKGSRLDGQRHNGVDRKNNDIGYTRDNAVSCCKFCNMAKNRWSAEEFIAWINQVKFGALCRI